MKARPSISFLPDFCAIRSVFVLVVAAELLAIVLTLAAASGLADFWYDLSVRSLFVQWITLVAAGLICLIKRYLGSLSHTWSGIIAWVLIILVAWGVTEIALWWIPTALFPDIERQPLLLQTLGISGIVGAVVLRYLYENYHKQQQELAESRARFQALQARIRPHFLFNSINTILSLISIDSKKAEEMLIDLSDLFRATLADESRNSTLGEELALVRQYIGIEQQRLGNRLRMHWDIDALPEHAPMPSLILQPLVENAVYHGAEVEVSGGDITLFGRYRNGVIALTVSNSLPEDNGGKTRSGNQIAQENIRQRLAVSFGDAAGLTTGMVDKNYQARIFFPYEQEESQ